MEPRAAGASPALLAIGGDRRRRLFDRRHERVAGRVDATTAPRRGAIRRRLGGGLADTPVAPTAIAGNRRPRKPGDVDDPLVLLPRHRRRAGAGRRSRSRSPTDFNASHPGHPPALRGYPYRGARRARRPDRLGQRSGHRRPGRHRRHERLPRPVARPQPLIDKNNFDMSQFPRAPSTSTRSAARARTAIPFAIYPSELFYQASLFEEVGPRRAAARVDGTYTMPDGSMVRWNYDTLRKIAMMLTVDKNGKDATEAGFDPKNIVQYGFEPQRDDLRQMGAVLEGRLVRGDDGKTVQIPDAWAAAWKWVYNGMWTDHFIMTGPQFLEPDVQPERLPVHLRQGRDEENFLWSTSAASPTPARTGTWPRCRRTTADHGPVQRRHLPDHQGHQAPRRGVHRPELPPPARQDAAPALWRHSRPSSRSRTPSWQRRQARSTRRTSTGRSSTTASRSPTSPTSRRHAHLQQVARPGQRT